MRALPTHVVFCAAIVLAAPAWGVVDDARITRDLLAVVAPRVPLTTSAWG